MIKPAVQFPVEISTKRLSLRRVTTDDTAVFFALRTHPEVNRYINRPPGNSIEKTREWVDQRIQDFDNGKNVNWAICLKGTKDVMGSICLWNFSEDRLTCEIGYDLFPEYHGKGIMSDAIEHVILYAFDELNVDRIEAFTQHDNTASKKLLDKFGFHLESERRDSDNSNNRIYVLTRGKYTSTKIG
jgi:ribosomal-protein-alanine N-acetyltransferase